MRKVFKKSLHYLPLVLILVATILIGILGISLKNNGVPNIFNRAMFYVKTPSMEPEIMKGDLIFVNLGETEYFPGDIISFRKSDEQNVIITHRIETIGGGLVTTKGDANDFSEDWEKNFSTDLIIGKYIGKSAVLGSVYEVMFENSIDVLFILIIAIFLLIGISELKNIINLITEKNKLEQEKEKQKLIEEELEKLRSEKKK